MTSQDHNKTLGLVHGLIGLLAFTAVIVAIILEMRKATSSAFPHALYFLPIPLLQLLVAYALFRRRRWARIIALFLSALYVWVFPLGTALAVYTWWFLHSEGGKRLYAQCRDI